MKKIVFMLLVLVAAYSCKQEEKFTLSGTLSGNNDLVIGVINPDGFHAIDTFSVIDGKVDYQMQLSEPVMLHIFPEGQRKGILIFAENTAFTITGSSDKIALAEVTGGAIHEEYKQVNGYSKNYLNKSMKYRMLRRAGVKNEEDKIKLAQLKEESQKDYEEYQTQVLDFIKTHASSPVAAYYALQSNKKKAVPVMKEAFDGLDKSLAGTLYYEGFANHITTMESVQIGAVAPDFTMNDVDGNPLTLSSLRGKYVLIDFWASWCGPCRAENPNVVKVYEQYKDKGFEILGVSLDKDKDKWLEAIEDDHLAWKHVSDLAYWDSKAVQLFAISGVPHTVLLDKDGVIIAKNLRGEALKNKISELLD